MYPQAVFNQVVAHLRQQNAQAIILEKSYPGFEPEETCQYLTPDGKKCAVGCMILPEEYHPSMEGKDVDYIFEHYPSFAARVGKGNRNLLRRLQIVHDQHQPSQWENQFLNVANQYGLDIPEKP